MRTAIAATVLSVALFDVPSPACATDMDNFRWDEFRGNCRVVSDAKQKAPASAGALFTCK